MRRITKILLLLLVVFGISFSLSWGQTDPNEWTVTYSTNIAQTNQIVVSAPTAYVSLYITDIVIANGATAGEITLLNGSSGPVIWRVYVGVNTTYAISLKTPIKLLPAVGLFLTSTSVTTHSVTICGNKKL